MMRLEHDNGTTVEMKGAVTVLLQDLIEINTSIIDALMSNGVEGQALAMTYKDMMQSDKFWEDMVEVILEKRAEESGVKQDAAES